MGIPHQQFTVNEDGTGAVQAAASIPLYFGYSSLGVANVPKTYSSIADVVANEGKGRPLRLQRTTWPSRAAARRSVS